MPASKRFIRAVCLSLAATAVALIGAGASAGSSPPSSSDGRPDVAYPHGEFREDCNLCHTADGWSDLLDQPRFDHGQTGFPLVAAHSSADCLDCHRTLQFEVVDAECASCHVDVHKGEFGADCAGCHGQRSFVDQSELTTMHRFTQFPLTGAHGTLDCDQCHRVTTSGLDFITTPTECFSCHESDFVSASSPNHVQAGFTTECTECHSTLAWAGGDYRGAHEFFPLVAGHAGLDCQACHLGGDFVAVDARCVSCHRPEYDATTAPAHSSAGFGIDCESCHTISSWEGAAFDHSTSAFPLTGSHRALECSQCHVGGTYTATPVNCVGCHQADFLATSDPPHAAAGFASECEQCHDTNAWAPARFDHDATSFALTGAHAAALCSDCHTQSSYAATSSDCYACHQADFVSASDPDHVAAGMPTACEQCHSTAAWQGASFDHALSSFPLTGAHAAVECTACHANNVFAGAPSDCFSCHQVDFAGTAEPDHASAGFGTDCEACHVTAAWVPATFDHDLTAFLLTGAHRAVECSQCHVGGVYSGTSTDCHACHAADYDATTNPAHAPAGFGTDCAGCHSTTTWAGATFDHDSNWFPINSGAHRGRWQDCGDCHTNPVNYSVFNCLNCHPHDDRARVDADHRGENGYRYDSVACYDCHPRGRG